MGSWEPGRTTVTYLLGRGRLEIIDIGDASATALGLVAKAERRLRTSTAASDGGDAEGSFVSAYDAYRMAAEALLALQSLRSTAGDGSHVTVEDVVSSQFAQMIPEYAKVTYERFRRTRHSAQYFDPDAPDVTAADADWAIEVAGRAIAGARGIVEAGELESFTP